MFLNGEVSILSTGENPRSLTASGIRTSPTSGKSMEFFMRMDTCSGLLARMIVPVSGSAEGSLSARANYHYSTTIPCRAGSAFSACTPTRSERNFARKTLKTTLKRMKALLYGWFRYSTLQESRFNSWTRILAASMLKRQCATLLQSPRYRCRGRCQGRPDLFQRPPDEVKTAQITTPC